MLTLYSKGFGECQSKAHHARNCRQSGTDWKTERPKWLRLVLACLIASCLVSYQGSVFANDSTASLDAGGLTLTFNPDISMESEDLYLSPGEVRVVYRFHNTSNHDIATLVAFPLPVMTIGEQGNYDLEGRDPVDLMDFKVTAEGKTVEPKVEIRATRFGVDVTDVLKR